MRDGQPKYCDLVMKGGITSGIVYPNAVLALAEEYRFKNIGGTSAGAIAAAVSAAAAMGERMRVAGARRDPKLGFEGLAEVSARLSTAGFIYRLFQPARGAKNAYRLLVLLAGHAPRWRKWLAALAGVLAIAPGETLAAFAVFSGFGYLAAAWPGVAAAALPSLLCAWAVGGVFALARVARVVRKNSLGLCSGLRADGEAAPALTDWMHEVLQSLSGKSPESPLTFTDLRQAPRYPDEPETEHAINLHVITTGVSHREPRTLPFDGASFWFLREEFDRLFPAPVVDWMAAQDPAPLQVQSKTYYRLPADGALPVLVAARMSLSFPLLISAVPLHEPARWEAARDRTDSDSAAPPEKSMAESTEGLTTGGERSGHQISAFRACWFSDGGISSNFPIHLFDEALPRWPTFAINLVYPKSDDAGRPRSADRDAVFLPTENNKGWQRTYQSIADASAAKEVSGFVFGIVATMQNWRDLLLARAPGQRDRIVHVSLDGDEGGMNLDMPQAVLSRISAKGTAAGERFREFSFENHYWVRWRNLASAWQRYTIQVAGSADPARRVPAYGQAYAQAAAEGPPPPSYKFSSEAKRKTAEGLLLRLQEQGEEWADLGPDLTEGAPRPLPQMKITPIY
ncbi:MAG TPA: patatin-like phospholipase family protein [Luteimonas sp.]|nr:patatin-like phospholipase family protein [Luteimonas sp.]